MLILRARGMQSESDIPFAGLSELLAPLLDRLSNIPPRQAAALKGALALGEAAGHDRYAVPAAVLSLLAGAAEERPVLVLVDDAQWLDETSLDALLFAARRLAAEGIAFLGAARSSAGFPPDDFAPWLERLEVGPLPLDDARVLLGRGIAAPVADRLVDGAAGNPLAFLEIRGCSRRPSARDASRSSRRSSRARASSGRSGAASTRCPRTRGARCWWRRRPSADG
jgi:hypothetical protein